MWEDSVEVWLKELAVVLAIVVGSIWSAPLAVSLIAKPEAQQQNCPAKEVQQVKHQSLS